jgi:hypothetical protein
VRPPRAAPAPAGPDTRLPLPSDPAELEKLVASLTRNALFERYQVPKMKASAMKKAQAEGTLAQYMTDLDDERKVA